MEATSTCNKHVQERFRVLLIWGRAMLSLVSQHDHDMSPLSKRWMWGPVLALQCKQVSHRKPFVLFYPVIQFHLDLRFIISGNSVFLSLDTLIASCITAYKRPNSATVVSNSALPLKPPSIWQLCPGNESKTSLFFPDPNTPVPASLLSFLNILIFWTTASLRVSIALLQVWRGGHFWRRKSSLLHSYSAVVQVKLRSFLPP